MSPGSFEIVGLDHVAITTPEELESEVTEWYRDLLGLERVAKPEGTRSAGAWFRIGDQQIHIVVDPRNPHRAAHYGIVVTDFLGIVERLRAAGCHIEQATPIPGRRRFFTRDPAGNSLEVITFDDDAPARVTYEETAANAMGNV